MDPTVLLRPYSPAFGPADAPVTLVEIFDSSCEACRAYHPVVQEIRRQFPAQVRVVLRYTVFHEGSDEAVRILEAARMQGKFEPVLDALLEKQPGPPETLRRGDRRVARHSWRAEGAGDRPASSAQSGMNRIDR